MFTSQGFRENAESFTRA